MKGIIVLAFFLMAFCTPKSEAIEDRGLGYSTATVYGVLCSTSVATRVDDTFPSAYKRADARVKNISSTYTVYIGFDTVFSTATTSLSNLGEELRPAESATYNVTKEVTIYCKTVGTVAAYISILQAGFKR